MSLTTLLSNADAKIKLLRGLEYICLFSEGYLTGTNDAALSSNLLYSYEKVKNCRKILRFLFFMWNWRKVVEYSNKDRIRFQRIVYIASKAFGSTFYLLESITAFMEVAKTKGPILNKVRRLRFTAWILGLLMSTIYSMTYLIHSYGKEAYLKDVSINKLKPHEIISIINRLAEERHAIIINVAANFMDLFLGLHYGGLIEKLLKTRSTNGVVGAIGVLCSAFRLVSLFRKLQKGASMDSDLFDGLFYGYD